MKTTIRLIRTPLGFALFGALLLGAPFKSAADCNSTIGFVNGDFEDWPPSVTWTGQPYTPPPTGWTNYTRAGTTPALERQATGVQNGTYYIYVLNSDTISDAGGIYQDIACNPGSVYQVAGWVRDVHEDAVGTVKVSPAAAGATYDTATQLYLQTGNTNWASFNGNVTASGTSMRLWLDFSTTGTKTSHVVAFDNFTVTRVSDPPPTKLAFSSVPAQGYVGIGFNVTVQAQDASGNPQCVTNDTTISLTRVSGSGSLGGTTSGMMASGQSSLTIAGVTYSAAETIQLTATPTVGMTTLTPATSVGIPIRATGATRLVYTAVPSFVNAGDAFDVTVQAQDTQGQSWPVTTTTTITLTKASGSGTLGGTTTGTILASTDSATISGVTYNATDAMTLTATASGGTPALTPVTSGNIYFRNAVNEPILWAKPSGAWDGTSLNWVDSTVPTRVPSKYADNDDVVFEDTQSGASPITVTLAGVFNPGSLLVNNSAKVFTLTGTGIGGGTGLTKQGSGILTLGGANTFTGPTELGGGTLIATHSAALGAGALTLDTASTTLELDNDTGLNFGRDTTVSASMTIKSGRLSSGATVTHTLGLLSVGASTLSVAQGPNVTGSAGLTFGAATQTGAAAFNLGANTLLTLASLDTGGASSTFQGAGSATVTGPVIGSGTVIMNGTGTLTLSGANTCSGGMTVSAAGKLFLGNGSSSSSGAVNVSGGGVLDLGASYLSIGGGAGDVTLDGGTLQTEDPGSPTGAVLLLPGTRNIILGAGGGTINMNGDATQLISYARTISGSSGTLTVINQGELRLYNQHNTFNKLVVLGSVVSGVNRGKITLGQQSTAGYNDTLGAVPASFIPDAITLSNATYNVNVASVTLDPNQGVTLKTGGGGTNMLSSASSTITNGIPSVISGSGPLTITGGYIVLGGANTFSNKIRFTGGATFITNGLALQNATVDFGPASPTDTGTLIYDSTTVTEVTWGGVSGPRNITVCTTPYAVTNVNIGNNNVDCTWSGHLNNHATGIRVTKIGSGTLTLQGQQVYSGDTTIQSGTLKLDAAGSISVSSIVIAGGATFDVSTLTTAMTLGVDSAAQALKGSGTGASGTILTAAGKGLTMGPTSPLQFTAYNGVTAPLTISGAGSLAIGTGNAVTVTTTTLLGPGSYKLVQRGSGNTTAVTGTPAASVTVNGSGASGAGSLRVTGGELYLDVAGGATPVTQMSIGPGSGGSLSINYSGGTGSQFVLLQTNKVAAPLVNWTRLKTNTVSPGSFTITPGSDPAEFYRVKSE